MGRGQLTVVPQVPPGSPAISGSNIRLADGSVGVGAGADGGTYRTTVEPGVGLREFTVGHTVPRGESVRFVTLNGQRIRYEVNATNRGKEVLVDAPTNGEQELIVETSG